MKSRLGLSLLLVLFAKPVVVCGQSNSTNSPAQAAYRRGYLVLQHAERGATSHDRRTLLIAAQREFTDALTFDPEHYRARGLLAQTLFGLSRETTDDRQALEFARVAQPEFATAAAHPSADWRILNSWGRFLTYNALRFGATATNRCAQLTEARQLFDRAQTLVRTDFDKSTIALTRAECLWEISQCTDSLATLQTALAACLDDLAVADKFQPAYVTGPQQLIWGRALLATGRATTNRTQLTAAVARLEESLLYPGDTVGVHYELARAHGLLGQATNALEHLRVAFTSPALREQATREPDLAALITQPEFVALIQAQPTGALAARLSEAEHEIARADEASTTPAARPHRYRAADLLAQIISNYPTAYRPQLLHAQTLAALARTADAPAESQRWWDAANQRCQKLTQLPEADAQPYLVWGALWQLAATERLADPAQQLEAYRQAAEKFELALKRVTLSGEKFRGQRELALALAEYGVRAAEKNALQKADRLFGEITRVTAGQREGRLYRAWGATLTGLGRLEKDRLVYRQAIEKLLKALEIDAQDTASRYQLAVAYSLIDQPQQSLRHLETCLTGEGAESYRRRAAADPDLHQLRRYPEFSRLIGEAVP
ncbi:MAG: hypothetical protein PCFJNLEI_03650 [Verrucomicrobiae bacterium]|nr:hypothetical protein [Verrucomicrobiae bacterium]